MAIIVIATYFDDSVKTTEDVEEATGLPTLGAIPRMPGGRGRSEIYQLATLLYPRSAAAEAYRTVRTNLEFASVDEPIQSLLVTSAGPGEGKSVTAANLAIAFAQAGRKVLLVDADLRKPGVHALFNLGNDRGLTNLLRGDDTRWESVVQPTEQEGLRVLTTGVQPPNPAELLGSQRMKRVLEKLAAAHELLIIDSPPLLIVTDAAILSSVANGTVLVIDAKRTRRDSARNAREALTKSGATRARCAAQRPAAQGLPGVRRVLRDRGLGPLTDVRRGELPAVLIGQVASRPIAPRMARSTSWTSYRSSAMRRLSRPIAASLSGSASSSVMPSASAAASRAGTSRPFRPGSTVPRQPGTSVVSTGTGHGHALQQRSRGPLAGRTAGR